MDPASGAEMRRLIANGELTHEYIQNHTQLADYKGVRIMTEEFKIDGATYYRGLVTGGETGVEKFGFTNQHGMFYEGDVEVVDYLYDLMQTSTVIRDGIDNGTLKIADFTAAQRTGLETLDGTIALPIQQITDTGLMRVITISDGALNTMIVNKNGEAVIVMPGEYTIDQVETNIMRAMDLLSNNADFAAKLDSGLFNGSDIQNLIPNGFASLEGLLFIGNQIMGADGNMTAQTLISIGKGNTVQTFFTNADGIIFTVTNMDLNAVDPDKLKDLAAAVGAGH